MARQDTPAPERLKSVLAPQGEPTRKTHKKRRLKLEELEVRVAPTSLMFGAPVLGALGSAFLDDQMQTPEGHSAPTEAISDQLPVVSDQWSEVRRQTSWSSGRTPSRNEVSHEVSDQHPASSILRSYPGLSSANPQSAIHNPQLPYLYGADSPEALPQDGQTTPPHAESNQSSVISHQSSFVTDHWPVSLDTAGASFAPVFVHPYALDDDSTTTQEPSVETVEVTDLIFPQTAHSSADPQSGNPLAHVAMLAAGTGDSSLNPQSPIPNPQSAIRNPQSAIGLS